jgi:hypothetical protein
MLKLVAHMMLLVLRTSAVVCTIDRPCRVMHHWQVWPRTGSMLRVLICPFMQLASPAGQDDLLRCQLHVYRPQHIAVTTATGVAANTPCRCCCCGWFLLSLTALLHLLLFLQVISVLLLWLLLCLRRAVFFFLFSFPFYVHIFKVYFIMKCDSCSELCLAELVVIHGPAARLPQHLQSTQSNISGTCVVELQCQHTAHVLLVGSGSKMVGSPTA